MPDMKTPLLWLLGLALAAALLGLDAQHIELANVRTELADEKAIRARQAAARSAAAAAGAVKVAGAQSHHAETQQEIVHDLTKPDPLLAAALADNRALAGRLRDTADKLAAATHARPEVEADPAACRGERDQLRAVLGLLEEAGRLSAESVDLAAEGRSVVVRRDSEVRALKALIAADRTLMDEGTGGALAPPAKLGD